MNTQCQKILHWVRQQPERVWFAKDFQNAPFFIGYEAGPRLCHLVNSGDMVKVGRFGKYTGYRLATLSDIEILSPTRKKTEKQKLKEAFISGWFAFCEIDHLKPEEAFDEWYKNKQ